MQLNMKSTESGESGAMASALSAAPFTLMAALVAASLAELVAALVSALGLVVETVWWLSCALSGTATGEAMVRSGAVVGSASVLLWSLLAGVHLYVWMECPGMVWSSAVPACVSCMRKGTSWSLRFIATSEYESSGSLKATASKCGSFSSSGCMHSPSLRLLSVNLLWLDDASSIVEASEASSPEPPVLITNVWFFEPGAAQSVTCAATALMPASSPTAQPAAWTDVRHLLFMPLTSWTPPLTFLMVHFWLCFSEPWKGSLEPLAAHVHACTFGNQHSPEMQNSTHSPPALKPSEPGASLVPWRTTDPSTRSKSCTTESSHSWNDMAMPFLTSAGESGGTSVSTRFSRPTRTEPAGTYREKWPM
mmetsp:Transcript_31604/g.69097  ORF Transcript_31604/g.69097 Transcript_31604/m.69097 type:complete len:364 (+) Transcript_31604:601-1692(+)